MPGNEPDAADVRKIRAFKIDDTALGYYIDLAAEVDTATVIPTAGRKTMWAFLAAHLATVMAEPEPSATSIGPLSVQWAGRGDAASLGSSSSLEALKASSPGREFLRRWKRYNRGRVLR